MKKAAYRAAFGLHLTIQKGGNQMVVVLAVVVILALLILLVQACKP